MKKYQLPLHSPLRTLQALEKPIQNYESNNQRTKHMEQILISNMQQKKIPRTSSQLQSNIQDSNVHQKKYFPFNEQQFIKDQHCSDYSIVELLRLRIPLLLNVLRQITFQQIVQYFSNLCSEAKQSKMNLMKYNIKYRAQNIHNMTQEIIYLINQLIGDAYPNLAQYVLSWANGVLICHQNDYKSNLISILMNMYQNTNSNEEKYCICQIMKLILSYPSRVIQQFLYQCNINDVQKLCNAINEYIHSNAKYCDFQFNNYDIIAAKLVNIGKLQQFAYQIVDSSDVSIAEQVIQQFVHLDKCTIIPQVPQKPVYAIQNLENGQILAHKQKSSCKLIMHNEQHTQQCNLLWFETGDVSHTALINKIKYQVQNLCYYGTEQSKIELCDCQSLQSLTLKNCQSIDLSNCVNIEHLSLQLVSNVDIQKISSLQKLKTVYINTIYGNTNSDYRKIPENQVLSISMQQIRQNSSDKAGKNMVYGATYNANACTGIQLLNALSVLNKLETITLINQELCKKICVSVKWSNLKAFQLKLCQKLEELSIQFILPQLPSDVIKYIKTSQLQFKDGKIHRLHLFSHCQLPFPQFIDVGDDVILDLKAIKISAYTQQNVNTDNRQSTSSSDNQDIESVVSCSSLHNNYSESSSRIKVIKNVQIAINEAEIQHNEIKNLLNELKSDQSESISLSLSQSTDSKQLNLDNSIVKADNNQYKTQLLKQQGNKLWEDITKQQDFEIYDIPQQNARVYIGYKQYSDIFANIPYLKCKNPDKILKSSGTYYQQQADFANQRKDIANINMEQS